MVSSSTQKELSLRLTQLEKEYEQLRYYLPDALLEIDILTPKLLFMNQMAFSVFGYSPDDLEAGIDLRKLISEEDFDTAAKLVRHYAQTSLESGAPYERQTKPLIFEFNMRRKDGSEFQAETQSSYILNDDMQPVGMRTIVRDITDRKAAEIERLKAQAAQEKAKEIKKLNTELQKEIAQRKKTERALRQSEHRYRELYQNTPSMYFTVDSKCVVKSVNQFGAEQLGYTVDELLDKDVLNVFHDDDKKGVSKQLKTCLKHPGQVFQWEGRKIKKDGQVMWVRETARAIERKKDSAIFITCEDVTKMKLADEERTRLQDQILQAQKLESLGDLAGGIAHDFNNLLTGILGHASLIKMDLPDASPLHENLMQIEESALQAAELTSQLLAYSGKGKYIVKNHNLSELVTKMKRLLDSATEKKVRIHYNLMSEPAAIEADGSQIRQLITNLITNAADAIEESYGTITIKTGTKKIRNRNDPAVTDSYAFLEVRDTGIGIDAKTQKKIFDPFFSTKGVGRGLGLAAVQGIVRGHEGLIELESQPGKGTSVRVLFPTVEPEEPTPKIVRDGTASYGEACVLVVDDQIPARTIAQKILEKVGYRVISASNGQEGVELFQTNMDKIKLVLLDMSMPEMSGEETLRQLRQIRPDVNVILSSGYSEGEAIDRFSQKQLSGFIQKPYQPKDLLTKIDEILET